MNTQQNLPANGGNFQHSLEKGVDTATTVAHHTIDSVSEAARPALDHLASNAHGAVDRAGHTASHVAGILGEQGDQLNDKGKRMVERAEVYVRQNPVASLGIAVAAGYILSRLFSSR